MADNLKKPTLGNSTQSKNHRKTGEHIRRPRQPRKPERGDNILYVCTKTNIKAQLEHCKKLINNNEQEIIIHCLGAAIQRGILLALQICDSNISYQIHTNTLTTELLDDLEPAADDADYELQRRFNSALRIRIFKKDPLENLN